MASGIFQQRPNALLANVDMGIFGGASSLLTAVIDNSDTTYVRLFALNTDWSIDYGTATASVASNEYIARIRVTLRYQLDGTAMYHPNHSRFYVELTNNGVGAAIAPRDENVFPIFGIGTIQGEWKQPADRTTYWKPADLVTLGVRIYGTTNQSFPIFYPRIMEVYVDREIRTLPTTTVTAPTGTQATSNTPATKFTYTSIDHFPMSCYQVKVFSAAQYGAAGFDPNVSVPTWDSGQVLTSTVPLSGVRPAPLLNNTTYKSYVQVCNNGTYNKNFVPKSPWTASPAYTISVNPPAAPLLSLNPNPTAGTIDVTVQTNENMLSVDGASFEATVGDWSALQGTIAQSATRFTSGTKSLALTQNPAGVTAGFAGFQLTGLLPVTPGMTYSFFGDFAAAVTARSVEMRLLWYNSAQAYLGTFATATTAESGTNFTTCGVTGTAPAGAVYCKPQVVIASMVNAAVQYADRLAVKPGNTRAWTRGGLLSGLFFELFRNVGGVQSAVLGLSTLTVPPNSQTMVIQDVAAPFGVPVSYTAVVHSIDQTSPGDILSSDFTTSGTTQLNSTDWWLSDPVNLPINCMPINVMNDTFEFDEHEEQAAYNPLGRKNPVVVSDVIHGIEADLEVDFLDKPSFDQFKSLRNGQGTLVLRSPMVPGEMWYVRIATDVKSAVYNTSSSYRTVKFSVMEQDVPS